ncbi:hypothetical protein [Azospirillum brasilense]|uniref:Uncharacterized protein n=1 Tax=Azospirillum brasilense TaxID=192 RepID=A0A6L3ARU1_AZOBR|nr:hypothetical protein [Azospirillum brasilense]KAA0676530.1 hypothetical protein DS837_30700 [Azospirillum brasilense]
MSITTTDIHDRLLNKAIDHAEAIVAKRRWAGEFLREPVAMLASGTKALEQHGWRGTIGIFGYVLSGKTTAAEALAAALREEFPEVPVAVVNDAMVNNRFATKTQLKKFAEEGIVIATGEDLSRYAGLSVNFLSGAMRESG